ncbi:MAG: hypothetical protein GWN07_27885, partial [Actinobacteria bacterium]|nr:hypothetical protein [Actinomycetota bacterium]NIU69187.1 hypothetical protein [Actinomycetota bacterium]NIW31048.1 hypothetical protein [Actinomycetota bacterium]NIX23440.1 hypothetical protein [Actinomycetota bacterium]
MRLTRREPDERYGDAGAVAHALRVLNPDNEPHELTHRLVTADPPDRPSVPTFPDVDPNAVTDPGLPAGPPRGRSRLLIAFLAGVVLAGGLFVVSRTGNGGDDGSAPAPDP